MTRGRLARLPIRAKLVAMIMITSATVLVLAAAGYLTWDYYRLRADLTDDLRAEAQLVLENSAAALNFRDERAAHDTLATLGTVPRLQIACLYDERGALFASWHRQPAAVQCAAQATADSVSFDADQLQLRASGFFGSKTFGSVYLESDTGVLTSRLRVQVAVTVALLFVALALGLLISSRLERLVSEPVLGLAAAAADVSARGDYSVRAAKVSEDEVGVLVDAFNRMLQQIQTREAELREANRLKDEFLATLSHELRTPLNAMLGWTRLLRAHALPPGSEDRALEKVERNAQAQARLVEDLLEVSRITTGKLRLDLRTADLTALVNAAVDSMRPGAEARSVTLTCDGLDEPRPAVADPDRLQQVVWNLLSNAVKFTPPGGTVSVTLVRNDREDVLTVRDTGVGIDPAFLPSVFDTFRQADASSTRQVGGLGLGLSIARRLVELHGGSMEAASDGTGRGATFTVHLPLRVPVEATAAAVGGEGGWRGSGRLSGTRVLVVDDDLDTLEMIVSGLEGAGATVLSASSADEAIRQAAEHHPGVLVSDIGMPGTDGIALLENLRAELGAGAPAVTIALTAYAASQDRERVANAGYQRHLAKPFDPLALIDVIAEMSAEPTNPRTDEPTNLSQPSSSPVR